MIIIITVYFILPPPPQKKIKSEVLAMSCTIWNNNIYSNINGLYYMTIMWYLEVKWTLHINNVTHYFQYVKIHIII